jgi:hypothetical protein
MAIMYLDSQYIKLLKPTDYFTYNQVYHSKILHGFYMYIAFI